MHMQKRSGKRACGIGAGCGCLGVVGFVGFMLWLTLFSNTCAKMLGLETYPVSGDARHFDPFKQLAAIRAKAGQGAILTEIEASFVRNDGTMDLQASYKPGPSATYKFVVPLSEPPKDAPPIGAGRGPDDRWYQSVTIRCYEVGQMRHVTRISGGSRTEYNYRNEGMEVDRGSPQAGKIPIDLSEPKLSCQKLWEMALAKGAPKDAVAVIQYDEDGYEFDISGSTSFELDPAGKER